MTCYLCGSERYTIREGQCRDNSKLKIHECENCSLVYLNNIDHIFDGFYEENGQVKSNTKSNIFNTASYIDTKRRLKQFGLKFANKDLLDFGCGKGLFLHKLKEESIANTLSSLEINRNYFETLNENFSHFTDIQDIDNESVDVITMFHVLEHLPDPLLILKDLYKKLRSGGRIIIEVPSSNDALLKTYQCESYTKFTYWSPHLYLFNSNTLNSLIKKTSFKVDYITQFQRYSLANHLHWLSKGKPAGHLEFSFLEDDILNVLYAKKLAEIGECDTVIAEIIKL